MSAVLPQLAAASLALQQTREQRDHALEQLRACSEQHERCVSALRGEMDGIRSERDQLAAALAQARDESDRSRQRAAALHQQSEQQTSALRQQVGALEQSMGALQQEHAAQQQRAAGLESELAAQQQRAAGLESELAAQQQRAAGLDAELAAQQQRAVGLETELATQKQRVAGLEAELATQKRRAAVVEEATATAQRQLGAAQSDLKAVRRERDDLQRRADAAAAEWRNKLAALQRQHDALLAERQPSSAGAPCHSAERDEELTVDDRRVAPIEPERDEQRSQERAAHAAQVARLEGELAETRAASDARIAAVLRDEQRYQATERLWKTRYEALAGELEHHRQVTERSLAERDDLLRERARELEALQGRLGEGQKRAAAVAMPDGAVRQGVRPQQRIASTAAPPRARPPRSRASTEGVQRREPTLHEPRVVGARGAGAQRSGLVDDEWNDSLVAECTDWSRTPPPDVTLVDRGRPAKARSVACRTTRPPKR